MWQFQIGHQCQTDSYGQKYIALTDDHSTQFPNQHQQSQMYGNQYQQLQPHFAFCYTCGVYGHLTKNCLQWALAQQNVPNYVRNTPLAATPPHVNRPNTPPSVFPLAFLLNSSPRLTQQLMTDYTLNPHVWNEITDKWMKWHKRIDSSSKQCLVHMKEWKVTNQGQGIRYPQIRTILGMTIANR